MKSKAHAGALIGLLVALLNCGRPAPTGPPPYRQLTAGGGEANSPSLSRDAKFVVYSSDQADTGKFDIWVQPVDQGAAVRLTKDPARAYDPVFSGDGKTVYFTSLREPQGIYRVAATGGESELVVRGGLSPQVSPNGRALVFVDRTGNLALLGLGDGSSRPLLENFHSSYAPNWSPDGKRILFAGQAATDEAVEWWILSLDGSAPKNTGLLSALRERGFGGAFAYAWLPGDQIVFAGKRGDQMTLWRFKLSPEGRIASDPVRATDDEAGDYHASYASGHLVFQRTRVVLNLWRLPVDANQGRVTGNPQRLTSTDTQKGFAALSRDGRVLLYSAEQQGAFHLVMKDLIGGSEKAVGPSSNPYYSVLNGDGSRYFYGTGSKDSIDIFTRAVSGWRSWWSQSICDHCGMPRGVTPDGRLLLVWADVEPENHIDLVDLGTGKPRSILRNLTYHFYGPELSPDGAWISFIAKTGKDEFHGYIARIGQDGITGENRWIRVNPSSHEFQMAFWSPDGNLLYLLSEHGEGNLNWLDALKLDPQTKQPTGVPFAVYHFKEPRVPTMDPVWNHPAAAADKIVLELGDVSTNVWMMDAPP
jgi:Tol biopolymer transport system component